MKNIDILADTKNYCCICNYNLGIFSLKEEHGGGYSPICESCREVLQKPKKKVKKWLYTFILTFAGKNYTLITKKHYSVIGVQHLIDRIKSIFDANVIMSYSAIPESESEED